ncbi:MAG: PAS domain S-box protein, partial [Candidatus Dadabacteria bacterium]
QLVYVNSAFERIWDRTAAELCGRPQAWLEAIHPDERERVAAAFREKAATGGFAEEFRVLGRDGSERWVYDRGFPVRDDSGQVVRIAGIAEDVTERKKAEDALRQSNEELETLVQSISHDLKAPLRAIEGFAEALVEEYGAALDSRAREYLGLMKEGVDRMDALLNDLLQHAQIRHGVRLEPVDLGQVVRAVLRNLEAEIEETGADVRVEGPLPIVDGHRATLEMMVQNLVGNALKFVAPGERPQVVIGCREDATSRTLFVRDRGIGVDPKYHERIFAIFERLHDRSKYPGTGVGLAIVKKAAALHGAQVGVESRPGEGSTFWVRFPRRSVRQVAEAV